MIERVDLSKVDVEEFLEGLRVRNIQRADLEYWRFSCPFPGHMHGDENPSAQMRDDSTAFHCFGCKRSGNAITFLSEYEGVSFMESRRWIKEQWGGSFREPIGGATSEWENARNQAGLRYEKQTKVLLDEEILDRFDVDWCDAFCEWSETKSDGIVGYLFNRGFEPETLLDWQVGYDVLSERFTIPVRDEDGRLVGFKGRCFEGAHPAKYLALGDKPGKSSRYGFPTYEKSQVVFGLSKAHATGRLIIVEGELNVLAMHQKGWKDVIATAGSALSETQARLIREHCDEALVFYDSDTAGLDGTWGYTDDRGRYHPGLVDALEPHMRVRVVPEHEGDAANMEADDIYECLGAAKGSVSSRPPMRTHVRT